MVKDKKKRQEEKKEGDEGKGEAVQYPVFNKSMNF